MSCAISGCLETVFSSVPDKALHEEVRRTLLGIGGVSEIHHQHLWSLDGEHHVLTVHIVMDAEFNLEEYISIKQAVAEKLKPYQLAYHHRN